MSDTAFKAGSAGQNFEKPKIDDGFYFAKVTAIKTKKADGTPFQKEYAASAGKKANIAMQAIVEFQLFNEERKNGEKVCGEEIIINNKAVVLGYWITTQYVTDGVARSAFGAETKSTKFLENFGWKWAPEADIELAEIIGKMCRVIVKDYTSKSGETFSVINSVEPIKGTVATPTVAPTAAAAPTLTKLTPAEFSKKAAEVTKMFEDGSITKEAYGKIMHQLNERL